MFVRFIESFPNLVPDMVRGLALLGPFCILATGAIPIEWRPTPSYDKDNKVSIKLCRQENTILFSLTSLYKDTFSKLVSEKNVCHFNQVPLSQLESNKAGPTYQCDICFIPFPNHHLGSITRRKKTGAKHHRTFVSYQHLGRRLRVVGNRAEVRWLTHEIAQWRNAR